MSLFQNYAPFKSEVLSYLHKCSNAFKETGDIAGSKSIDAFMKDFEALRYNLTIVGSIKRGKSTLLNTLMERVNDDISPVSLEVCTSAIIKYMDKSLAPNGANKEMAVIYFDDAQAPCQIPFGRLREYVTETSNPRNEKKVHAVEVFGDFPEWSKAVNIVDSPGQNGVYDYHDTLLTDFLPAADAIVFLIAADLSFDGGDLKLLEELSQNEQRKIFFVLTKTDSIESEDLPLVEQHALSVLSSKNIACPKLYKIAAKNVFDALKQGISGYHLDEIKAANGLLELEKDLEQFVIRESSQTQLFRTRTEKILLDTQKRCSFFIDDAEKKLSQQNFDVRALSIAIDELKDKNKELRRETQGALRKFESAWSRKLNSFERKFSAKGPQIDDRVMDSLEKGGFVAALFKSFKLKKQIQSAVSLELQPLVADLEEQLQEVVEALNHDFDDAITVYVKKSQEGDYLTPTSSVVAAAAMIGTANWSWTTASVAFNTAMSGLSTWGTAATAATNTGMAVKELPWYSCFRHLAWWDTGWDKTIQAADVARDVATGTGAAAVTGIVGAIVSMGISIAVSFIVQKLLHIGLVQLQSSRVPQISEQIIAEMEKSVFKSLDTIKRSIVAEYSEKIEDIIAGNNDKIEENKRILISHDPEAIAQLECHLGRVKELAQIGNDLQSRLPLLEA